MPPAPAMQQPVQGVRGAPPAPPVVLQPGQAAPPARVAAPDPADRRGRGPKDADERDDRQPPGQDRRRDPRERQTQ